MNSTQRDLLLKQPGFLSLQAEHQLASVVRSLGWNTTHSFYYTDPITEKDREIDILKLKM